MNYCVATTSIELPNVDQRGFARGDIPDAGAFELDAVLLNLQSISSNPSFKIYPNPASVLLNIEGIQGTVKDVQIYSMMGQLKKQTTETSINISDLSTGVYLVKITSNDNNSITKRVVVK